MSHDDRVKWDARHAARAEGVDEAPVAFLCDHVSLVPRGRALDVACGSGRNAVFLAEQGFDVLAVDVSPKALANLEARAAARGVRVTTLQRDVATDGLPPGAFDLVVVTYFLERRLNVPLVAALSEGGALVQETYTARHAERTGFNRAYCLDMGELLRAFGSLRVAAYREHPVDGRDVASLLAFR